VFTKRSLATKLASEAKLAESRYRASSFLQQTQLSVSSNDDRSSSTALLESDLAPTASTKSLDRLSEVFSPSASRSLFALALGFFGAKYDVIIMKI
jgi:hypothetical protein